jgi:hypothetical protein
VYQRDCKYSRQPRELRISKSPASSRKRFSK